MTNIPYSGGMARCAWVGALLVSTIALGQPKPAAGQQSPAAPPPGSLAPPSQALGDSNATRDDRDPIVAATREYHASGVARTVIQGDFLTFPFGHAQPTLTCTASSGLHRVELARSS